MTWKGCLLGQAACNTTQVIERFTVINLLNNGAYFTVATEDGASLLARLGASVILVKIEIEGTLNAVHSVNEPPDVWVMGIEVALEAVVSRLHVVAGGVITVHKTTVELPHGVRIARLGAHNLVLQTASVTRKTHNFALA